MILFAILVAIAFERSSNTFRKPETLFSNLKPNKRPPGIYLTECLPIFIYSGTMFISMIFVLSQNTPLTLTPASLSGALLFIVFSRLRNYCVRYLGDSWQVNVKTTEKAQLVTTGPYKKIRNPYYLCSAIEFFGLLLFLWGIGTAIALGVIQLIAYSLRAKREETFLEKKYGEAYKNYCTSTGFLLPKIKR